jgi:hypothetical protein
MAARNRSAGAPAPAAAASPGRFDFAAAVKAVLPGFAVDALRRARDGLQSAGIPDDERPLDADFAQRWSVADLFYVEDMAQIDRSLDLMAECRK